MANDAERSLIQELEAAVDAMLRGQRVAPAGATRELLGIASDLRDLPRDSFLARLAEELQEEGEDMLTATTNIPAGFHTVTPYIVVKDALDTIEFITKAFAAEETSRFPGGSGGGYHIEARVGHSMLMLGGGGNYAGPEHPANLHYFVSDVDETYRRALAAGATSIHAPVDQHYGVREASVRDIAGNDWYISTPMKDAGGREVLKVGDLAPYFHAKGADQFIDFLKRAFGAEEMEVYREPSGTGPIVHAKIRIQDSIVELSEAHGQYQPRPAMIFLYVDDADAWFQRALSAGAKVNTPMSDQAYGRTGAVIDDHGNKWYVCTPPAAK
jgi:PhnB protein